MALFGAPATGGRLVVKQFNQSVTLTQKMSSGLRRSRISSPAITEIGAKRKKWPTSRRQDVDSSVDCCVFVVVVRLVADLCNEGASTAG